MKILREWAVFEVFNLLDTICIFAKSEQSQWNHKMIDKIWNIDTLQTSPEKKGMSYANI